VIALKCIGGNVYKTLFIFV